VSRGVHLPPISPLDQWPSSAKQEKRTVHQTHPLSEVTIGEWWDLAAGGGGESGKPLALAWKGLPGPLLEVVFLATARCGALTAF